MRQIAASIISAKDFGDMFSGPLFVVGGPNGEVVDIFVFKDYPIVRRAGEYFILVPDGDEL